MIVVSVFAVLLSFGIIAITTA
ncbi:YnhF family membrane protein [Vibrio parahaemolyticus]|nr:YnhF family membrane protein [Vibrio parahaemolyticus]